MGELIVGILGIVTAIVTFYVGLRQGRKEGEEQRAYEWAMERDRRRYEEIRRVADRYITMAQSHLDNGPHALATLGLETLGQDQAIREAITLMYQGSGQDPWAGWEGDVEGVDLVRFFRYVRQRGVNLFNTTVAEVAESVKREHQDPE